MHIICTFSTQFGKCVAFIWKTECQRKKSQLDILDECKFRIKFHLPMIVDDVPVKHIQFVIRHAIENLFQGKNIDKMTGRVN